MIRFAFVCTLGPMLLVAVGATVAVAGGRTFRLPINPGPISDSFWQGYDAAQEEQLRDLEIERRRLELDEARRAATEREQLRRVREALAERCMAGDGAACDRLLGR